MISVQNVEHSPMRSGRALRVMVCPHELVMGGSQINAIDLAARLRDRGHQVEIYAPPGPLEAFIAERGLPYVSAPPFTGDSVRPEVLIALAREIRRFRPDIVHTYESPPAIASAAVSAVVPHRNVTTVMSMSVPDFIPAHVPLFVGTAELAEQAAGRRGTIHLMEPPIDTEFDAPDDVQAARRSLGIEPDAFIVAVVGRLSHEHQKAKGVAAAIGELVQRDDIPPRTTLIVAGAGDGEADVRRAAAEACGSNPKLTIRLLGDVMDPRPVYDAADVVFGMGDLH